MVSRKKLTAIPPEIDAVDLPKVTSKLLKIPELQKIKSLIEKTTDKKTKALLLILATTAARISSVAALTVEDIGEDSVTFRTAKGNKPYIVPLPAVTKEAILNFLEGRSTGSIFNSTSDNLRMYLKNKLGDDYINPHSIRHSVATELIEKGMDVTTLSDILNHANIATTQRYIHLSVEHKRKSLKNKHILFEMGTQ